MATARPRAPGFFTHLVLLWGLRLRIGLNRGSSAGSALAVLGFFTSSAPAVALALTFYRLMLTPAVAESVLWQSFIVRLLSFVTTAVWATWPVLSAGVDDHSELSRYAAFPITSFRLMLASTLAGLFEPRALVFYGPLVGASVGYLRLHPPEYPSLVLGAFGATVLFNAALSRVGLNLVLNLLRQQRSAELIGGGFALTLLVASFIPPVDTSWLFQVKDLGAAAVPDLLIENAVLALGRFPTGWYARAVAFAADGCFTAGLTEVFALFELMLLTLVVAWGLLLQFHRRSGRGQAAPGSSRKANPFVGTRTLLSTLVVREALDLWHNPRARLLVAVPFVLGILLKLLSGRALFAFFLGASADAWVMGGLSVYAAIVMASTFAQNAFAYDGTGFTVFLVSPLPLGEVLKAKNAVHGLSALGLALLVEVFYLLYFRAGGAVEALVALTAVLALIPVLLTAGNFLSLFFPVKFHANLKRRDRLPFVASMLGVTAASVGTWPFVWALKACGRSAPGAATIASLVAWAVVAWGLYLGTLPVALRWVSVRREKVLRAVTRE